MFVDLKTEIAVRQSELVGLHVEDSESAGVAAELELDVEVMDLSEDELAEPGISPVSAF